MAGLDTLTAQGLLLPTSADVMHRATMRGIEQGREQLSALQQQRAIEQADVNIQSSLQNLEKSRAEFEEWQGNAELRDMQARASMVTAQIVADENYQRALAQSELDGKRYINEQRRLGVKDAKIRQEREEMQRGLDIADAIDAAMDSGDVRQIEALARQLDADPAFQEMLMDRENPIGAYVQAAINGDSEVLGMARSQKEILRRFIQAPLERQARAKAASLQYESQINMSEEEHKANLQIIKDAKKEPDKLKLAKQVAKDKNISVGEAILMNEKAGPYSTERVGKGGIPDRPTAEERAYIAQQLYPDDWFGLNKEETQTVEKAALVAKQIQETASLSGQSIGFDEAVNQALNRKAPSNTTRMLSPDGTPYDVPNDQVETARQKGWK